MDKLKPCPFCGADGERVAVKGNNYGVECYRCGAWMPERLSTNPEENHGAVEGWNRRNVGGRYDR